jgi:hypothetical protein
MQVQVDVAALVKNTLRRAAKYRYHSGHGVQANEVLKTLEGKFGKTNPANIKLADAYARDVLGHIRYAPWLHVYTALNGSFKEGWIPDNYYGSIVVPRVQGQYGRISHLKALTNIVFESDAFPDLAYFVNGLFFTPERTPIHPRDVKHFLFSRAGRVVFKVDSSRQGKGVFFFDKESFDVEKIRWLGNGVLQHYIIQHALFDDFSPNAVATLRITSVVDVEGEISVRACFLRLGRCDDTHVQPLSEISVPVNLSTGELARHGYLPDWLTIEEHPDTKRGFSGVRIPAFAKCISTVLELHKKIPFARCIGWDLIVDSDERVRLMEWNAEHNDIKFSEATQGPCFADLGWERLSLDGQELPPS